MGIFELADYTGLDVIHKASNEMASRDKKVINPNPLIERLFSEKNLDKSLEQDFTTIVERTNTGE